MSIISTIKTQWTQLINNPLGFYFAWFAVFILFCTVGVAILNIGHSDGDDIILTSWGYALGGLCIGLWFISLVSTFFKKYYKNSWHIHLTILVSSSILIAGFLFCYFLST